MARMISKCILTLSLTIILCGVFYPLFVWVCGQFFFPFQANGSIIQNQEGAALGSHLIAQRFTNPAYFHPRPSAASYNASASAASCLAPSNSSLRHRVEQSLGLLVTYADGKKAGQTVGPDIEKWFQASPHRTAQWAKLHPSFAKAWVQHDPERKAYVDSWAKTFPTNGDTLYVRFFQIFSQENPGKFPSIVDGTLIPIDTGPEIQSLFFSSWQKAHPNIKLNNVPADMVMSSASGLDPHITLQNAEYQAKRVAITWSHLLNRDILDIQKEIEELLHEKAFAPLMGLAGEKLINVLEINLALHGRYGQPL